MSAAHNPPGAVLVLRLSALGDVIHTIPAVVALRSCLPSATRIGWVVERPLRELVEIVAPVDEVFAVTTRAWRRAPLARETRSDVIETSRRLRGFTRGEVAVDFQGLLKSSILGFTSGARRRIGLARDAIREPAAGMFLNERVAIDRTRHVVEWNMDLAAAVCGQPFPRVPAVDFHAFAKDSDGNLSRLPVAESLIVLPGAGREEKLWDTGHFTTVVRAVGERGVPSMVVWGPGEQDRAERIARDGGCLLAPATDLRQLAWILSHARAVLGGDTGPLHLAAALGVPVVGLYGPTDPARNGPYGQIDRCVSEFGSSGSMSGIRPDDVLVKLETIL